MATIAEKKAAINDAWKEYREKAAKLSANRRLSWLDYLEADQRIWSKYLSTEAMIHATKI
jgi:hypothetical protein